MQNEDNKPTPPEDLEGEALLEWSRITSELQDRGALEKSDRAMLTLYVETWAVHRAASKGVNNFGSVIKFSNGATGVSPFFKVQSLAAARLHSLLVDLGLTPTSRTAAAKSTEPNDLEV